ncbi:GAG-pre-integrase domain [Popillia japonica]|uniref:GAG-pre-integrase domain n=1 Tax=Popillia japonica TaxID=7064 RepID=A0AAW1N0C8_POPJA
MYKLNLKEEKCMLSVVSETWHRRLGHINGRDLNKMKNCVNGIDFHEKIDKFSCTVCCEGKQAKLPFPREGYSENIKGYRVYDPELNDVRTSRDVIIYVYDPELNDVRTSRDVIIYEDQKFNMVDVIIGENPELVSVGEDPEDT